MTRFEWGEKTFLMGILNATPDSFSGDGQIDATDAIEQGIRIAGEGSDIVDVGGESTKPGATPVSLEEELARVIPIIERLAKEISIPISVDTHKAEVARQAIAAGATIINDVTAGRDPAMFSVAAESGVSIVLMHNRTAHLERDARLGSRYVEAQYADLLADIKKELQARIDAALGVGVRAENIIIDPGIGFGKTVEQNLELIRRLEELKTLGYPILVGPSRKSFVGYALNLPPEERLEGTAAAVALCIQKGADIVRVHDVREMRRVAALTDAIVRRRA